MGAGEGEHGGGGHILSSALEAHLAFRSITRMLMAFLFLGSKLSCVFSPTGPVRTGWTLPAAGATTPGKQHGPRPHQTPAHLRAVHAGTGAHGRDGRLVGGSDGDSSSVCEGKPAPEVLAGQSLYPQGLSQPKNPQSGLCFPSGPVLAKTPTAYWARAGGSCSERCRPAAG